MKQALEEAVATGTDVQDHDHHGIRQVLRELGVEAHNAAWSTGLKWGGADNQNTRTIHSPADGKVIGTVAMATAEDYEHVVAQAQEAFTTWRTVPAPQARRNCAPDWQQAPRLQR